MKVLIIANGFISDYALLSDKINDFDYVIACDGGLRHGLKMDIKTDCLLGDMDSVAKNDRILFSGKTITYPSVKEETDLALGVRYALEIGASKIQIIGALGGRVDHELANIHTLVLPREAGIPAEIINEKTSVQLCTDTITVKKDGYDFISLIPLTSAVKGIFTQGLTYPLCCETLTVGTSRGISNRFLEEEAVVSVKEGILIVVRSKE
jgi:thiamine pyrophosphokinase